MTRDFEFGIVNEPDLLNDTTIIGVAMKFFSGQTCTILNSLIMSTKRESRGGMKTQEWGEERAGGGK